jgi:hypothetical protein
MFMVSSSSNVVVRHDIQEKDGSSSFSTATSSPSSVVESELKLIERSDEMVTVNNNCVNIDYAHNINTKEQLRKNNEDDNNKHTKLININNEKEIVNSINPTTNAAVADTDAALDDQTLRQLNDGLSPSLAFQNCHDDANLAIISNFKEDDDDGDKRNNSNNINDDDDALKATSSNYSDDVFRRCEMSLQSSPSTSALPHVAQNTAPITPENNRNHQQAVRKNFSLWIGVTSCVWACLVWLMKNYA